MNEKPTPDPPQKYECPLVSRVVSVPCSVKSCMYNEGTPSLKGCRYAKVHETLLHRETLTKDVKKKTVGQLFSLEEADLGVAIRRVMNVLHVNEFFTHMYDKNIMEARPRELAELASAWGEEKYLAWRPSAKKVPFPDIIATLEFLKNNLT